MPDPHRLERELRELLSRPQYSSLFYHRNLFKKPSRPDETPEVLAHRTVDSIMKFPPFHDPVTVEEFKGGQLQFYRVHDGSSGMYQLEDGTSCRTAGTLGGFWVERQVVETIWSATERWDMASRENQFMSFLRSANFIHPEWNRMKQIACMQVPAGTSVVVIRGKGTWKAMMAPPGKAPQSAIRNPGDVLDRHGSMPIPGLYQCLIPLYSDMWVAPVSRMSPKWPLMS